MAELSYSQWYNVIKDQGATDYEADQLAAIAMAESGGNTGSTNNVGETSIGAFQINLQAHNITEADARNPEKSARFALGLFREQGPVPWTVSHDEHRGTDRDYRNWLKGIRPATGEQAAWVGSLSYGDGSPVRQGNAPAGGDAVLGTPGVSQSPASLDTGGANFNFDWPKVEDYPDFATWMDVTGLMAATYGAAGIMMPAGVSEFAKAAWTVANNDAMSGTGDLDPTQKALNIARAAQIAEEIRAGKLLLPYDLEKIRQDIRLAEPFGSEAVLRSPDGQAGFDDYWAGNGPKRDGTDYLAGFNLAKAGDEPRQTAVASYLDRIAEEIGQEIEIRGQSIEAASAEMRNKINLFDTAQRSFTDIQQYTIPEGSEFVPGYEPGGFAESIGLGNVEASPISYDPFQIAVDINASTPAPTSFSEPTLPGVYDEDTFNQALDFYRGML